MIDEKLKEVYKLRLNTRPIKHAYFFYYDDWETFKKVLEQVGTQWGGIRNLLIPVSRDNVIPIFYQTILAIHEPDFFISFIPQSNHSSNKLLQTLLILFPYKQIEFQDGNQYRSLDRSAHALHVIPQSKLLGNRLSIRYCKGSNTADFLTLVLFGGIYPGQEMYYENNIECVHEEITEGSFEFWRLQTITDPFESVINLTSYHISAYEVKGAFDSIVFNVVFGDDINSLCLFWNLRATKESQNFGDEETRRVLLAPKNMLENKDSLINMVNVIKKTFPTLGKNSDLQIIFNVWDEQNRDSLKYILSRNQKYLVKLKGKSNEIHYYGQKIPPLSNLDNKKISYLVGSTNLPETFFEGVDKRHNNKTKLDYGTNEILIEPYDDFVFPSSGSIMIDYDCEIWKRFPKSPKVARIINKHGWFSRYGFSVASNISNRPTLLLFYLPNEWEGISAFFQKEIISIERSRLDDYANGVINVLNGWNNINLLASKSVYLLLDLLALQSSKKLAQRIIKSLNCSQLDSDSLVNALQEFEMIPEIKGKPKTYEQLVNDQCLVPYKGQILSILNKLSANQVIKRGLYLNCPNCGVADWYPLNLLSEQITCSGCSHKFTIPVEYPIGSEIRWQYKLNTLINRAMDQDILVPMFAINHLTQNKEVTSRVVGLNVIKENNIIGDLDFVYVFEGQIFAGECKAGITLSQKDIETAFLAFELGINEFYFCTIKHFNTESLMLIEEARKKAKIDGYSQNTISILTGKQLLGEEV